MKQVEIIKRPRLQTDLIEVGDIYPVLAEDNHTRSGFNTIILYLIRPTDQGKGFWVTDSEAREVKEK